MEPILREKVWSLRSISLLQMNPIENQLSNKSLKTNWNQFSRGGYWHDLWKQGLAKSTISDRYEFPKFWLRYAQPSYSYLYLLYRCTHGLAVSGWSRNSKTIPKKFTFPTNDFLIYFKAAYIVITDKIHFRYFLLDCLCIYMDVFCRKRCW